MLAVAGDIVTKGQRNMSIKRKSRTGGFSLLELLVAMTVLTIGILGSMLLIIIGIERNNANRVDTTGTNAAQAVLEEIAGIQANTSPTLHITDCLGTSLTISTAVGGAPLYSASTGTNGAGAGDIDFTQAAVNGYQANYTICGNNGLQTLYDVRWRIDAVGTNGYAKLVTVSARQPGVYNATGLGRLWPVTLQTILGE
jgi:Tfp pilus assembly protein PilV